MVWGTHSDSNRARGGISVEDTVSMCLCDGHILIVTGQEVDTVSMCSCEGHILIVAGPEVDTVSMCLCEGHILIVAEPEVASVLRTQCPRACVTDTF